jgi:hypothetical protein
VQRYWWVVLAGSLSCDDHLLGDAVPIGVSCLRDPPLTYENFGDGILDRHCNSCHSVYTRQGQRGDAPLGVDFDTWEDTLDWAERIYVRAVDTRDMPPSGGTMVPEERVKLEEWFRCEVFPALGIQQEGPATTTAEEGT